jgi:hypothetical protein
LIGIPRDVSRPAGGFVFGSVTKKLGFVFGSVTRKLVFMFGNMTNVPIFAAKISTEKYVLQSSYRFITQLGG